MQIEAIVIKKTALREHDQQVTLYSRQSGKLVAVAKSVLKGHSIQALQLDEGNLVRLELVPGRGMPIITGAQAVVCHSLAKSSALHWAACTFFLQVIDAIVYDQQQDELLFDCLSRALADLDHAAPETVVSVFRGHQQNMLHILGYGRGEVADTGSVRSRTEVDDTYERIAQRRMGALDLFYDLANMRFS